MRIVVSEDGASSLKDDIGRERNLRSSRRISLWGVVGQGLQGLGISQNTSTMQLGRRGMGHINENGAPLPLKARTPHGGPVLQAAD